MASDYEEARLEALHRLNLLDTAPSEAFDRITRMASRLFGLPIAAVSLTDNDRQWFKSRVGVEHWSIPREKAPCAEVAATADVLVVPDLLACDTYRGSLLAQQGVRFYAGAPLTTRDGFSLGALCVLGTEPRETSEEEIRSLTDLARIVMDQIELQHALGRIDPVSGLPNRNQFAEDLADLGRDSPGERRLAVLLDLARVEQLSSGLRVMGNAYLDEIVRNAASDLSRFLGPGRVAYHVAATQFLFLAQPGVDQADYVAMLERSLAAAAHTARSRFVLTAVLGVVPFVTGVDDAATVLRTAHSASQDARTDGTFVGVYSVDVDAVHQRRFRLLNDFGTALEAPAQLSLAYQPRIDLRSGACVGVEALLRWHHPELGPVSPAEFIPIVEQTSLAVPLTAWVLDQGLAQLARWRAAGIHLQLAVNVSATNLEQDDFAGTVQLHLLKHRLPPEALEIEVTESAMMQRMDVAVSQMEALAAYGVGVAIDDFGTGYSSLSYLQRLPARVLKIDRSFVLDMLSGEREESLVGSMIALAHDLGYRVVAEGIETEAAHSRLVALGCDEGQGFLLGRPMECAALERWLAARSAKDARAAG